LSISPDILLDHGTQEIEALTAFAIRLFKELDIGRFVNNSTSAEGLMANLKTDEFKLSDGQMQKIAAIQDILHNISFDAQALKELYEGLKVMFEHPIATEAKF